MCHNAGYDVHLLGSDRLVGCKSKLLAGRIPCAPGPEAAAGMARAHLATDRARYKTIVLADEPTLWAAVDLGSTDWLEGWFPVPLTPASLALVRSKTAFLCGSVGAGISTPEFYVCKDETEVRRAADSMGFPLYVKASKGWAGSGLLYVTSQASFEEQLVRISYENSVVVQKETPGESASISVLYDHGIPVCWFAYRMLNTWPNRFSSACTAQLFPHPGTLPLVRAVGRLTQFTGLAGIDFIWNQETDQLTLLEFNCRPTPVYHLGPRAGVDFAHALREMSSGKAEVQLPNRSAEIINLFPQMLYYSVEHLQPAFFLSALRDAPWAEPALAAANFRRFLTHYLPDSLKRMLKR